MLVPFLHPEEWIELHPDLGTRSNCSAGKGLGEKSYTDKSMRQFKTEGPAISVP